MRDLAKPLGRDISCEAEKRSAVLGAAGWQPRGRRRCMMPRAHCPLPISNLSTDP